MNFSAQSSLTIMTDFNIELGPVMQPIVYANHSSPVEFGTVSVVPVHHPVFLKRNDRVCDICLVHIGKS